MRLDGGPLRDLADLVDALKAGAFSEGLVCKPVLGTRGTGIKVFSEVDVVRRTLVSALDQTEMTIAHALGSLVSSGSRASFVPEERIASHPFCEEINPFTASTIRVITLRDTSGGVHIPFAGVRLGRRGSMVDNVSQGGLFVEIKTGTGKLGEGRQHPYRIRSSHQAHPDTGRVFQDRLFPRWREVIDLCTRAAIATPGLHTVGWDVLLGPAGPVLLEGNHDWAVQVTQLFGRGYLTADTRALLREHNVIA